MCRGHACASPNIVDFWSLILDLAHILYFTFPFNMVMWIKVLIRALAGEDKGIRYFC